MYFDELDLNDNVLDALYDMHFETCTPVQEKCIPEILKGNDVLGVAQTGTGKTAAYLLPILSKLADGDYSKDTINCVIMSPTRELAQQIDQAIQGFDYYLNGVSSLAIYGGNDGNRYDQELKSLTLGADVIIATPGRLLSHITMGNADLSKVSFFVLDEVLGHDARKDRRARQNHPKKSGGGENRREQTGGEDKAKRIRML